MKSKQFTDCIKNKKVLHIKHDTKCTTNRTNTADKTEAAATANILLASKLLDYFVRLEQRCS